MQPNHIRSPWDCYFSSYLKPRSFIYVEIIKAEKSKHHFSYVKLLIHTALPFLIPKKHSLDILKLMASTVHSCWLVHDHFYKTNENNKETEVC